MNVSTSNEQDPWASVDRDCLLLAIEQSLRVRAHAHFFSWTQGALQAIVPHDVLFCATFDRHAQMVGSDVLCPMLLDAQARETITRPYDGLMCQLIGMWEQAGRLPLFIDPALPQAPDRAGVLGLLASLGFENVAVHGSWSPGGAIDTFFGFARVGKPLDARLAELVEIVMPHLRAALIRIQPRKRGGDAGVRARPLTGRESEILQLLQYGRSNAEIGIALSISPLTVKNHVQSVLRKLGVRNRTQAVALDLNISRNRNG